MGGIESNSLIQEICSVFIHKEYIAEREIYIVVFFEATCAWQIKYHISLCYSTNVEIKLSHKKEVLLSLPGMQPKNSENLYTVQDPSV